MLAAHSRWKGLHLYRNLSTCTAGEAVKRIFRHLPQHVVVITATNSVERRGITVSSFTTLSIDPPRVIFNVKKPSKALEAMRTEFVANLLFYKEDHIRIAKHFAANNKRESSDQELTLWRSATDGACRLAADDVSYISCTTEHLIEVEDHCIIIGLVKDVHKHETEISPLFYKDHNFIAHKD